MLHGYIVMSCGRCCIHFMTFRGSFKKKNFFSFLLLFSFYLEVRDENRPCGSSNVLLGQWTLLPGTSYSLHDRKCREFLSMYNAAVFFLINDVMIFWIFLKNFKGNKLFRNRKSTGVGIFLLFLRGVKSINP